MGMKTRHVSYFNFIWILMLFIRYGKSQICNPTLQNDRNTVKFCQKGTATAQTIFLVSGATRLQAVSGCLCAVVFPRGTSNITLSYDNGYPHRDCGIKIITENEDVFDCYSKEITVQKPFVTFQFSKTTHAADKHFCLQVTPELDNRVPFTVQYYQEVQSDTMVPGSSSSKKEEDEIERTTSVYFQTSKKDTGVISTSNDTEDTAGPLIGGVVGGLAVILVIAVFIYIRYRCKRRESDKLDTTVKEEFPAIAYSVENNSTHQQETANPDSDLVMTYNDMYAMETSPIFENQINREEVTGSTDQTKELNNELVLTDNAMYKMDSQNIEYNDADSVEERKIQGVKYSIDKREADQTKEINNELVLTENAMYKMDSQNIEYNDADSVKEGKIQGVEYSIDKREADQTKELSNKLVLTDNAMYEMDSQNIEYFGSPFGTLHYQSEQHSVKESKIQGVQYSIDKKEAFNNDSEMTENAMYRLDIANLQQNDTELEIVGNNQNVSLSTNKEVGTKNEQVMSDNPMYKLDTPNIRCDNINSVIGTNNQHVNNSPDKTAAPDDKSVMTANPMYKLDHPNIINDNIESVTEQRTPNKGKIILSDKTVTPNNELVMTDNPMYKLDHPNIINSNIESVSEQRTPNKGKIIVTDKTVAPNDELVMTDNPMYKLDHPNIINSNIESVSEQRTPNKGKIIVTDKTVAPNDELVMTDNPMYKLDHPNIINSNIESVSEQRTPNKGKIIVTDKTIAPNDELVMTDNPMYKHEDYRIRPFLSTRHAHGDLCKHLGID